MLPGTGSYPPGCQGPHLHSLAAAIGEERDTIEDVIEPYLIQLGLVQVPVGPGRGLHRERGGCRRPRSRSE